MAYGTEEEIELGKLIAESNQRCKEFLSVRTMINDKYSKGEFSIGLSDLYIQKLNAMITADNRAYLYWFSKFKKN